MIEPTREQNDHIERLALEHGSVSVEPALQVTAGLEVFTLLPDGTLCRSLAVSKPCFLCGTPTENRDPLAGPYCGCRDERPYKFMCHDSMAEQCIAAGCCMKDPVCID